MRIIALSMVAATASCGTIRTHRVLAQPVMRSLVACPGGEVLRTSNTRDLPNAFGRADVWGGQVDAGYERIVYLGILPSGDMLFRAMSVDTISSENSVNRYLGGEVVRGLVGPRLILPGSTSRVPGRQQDLVVDRRRSLLRWRHWEIVLGKMRGTRCVKYHIAPIGR